MILNHTREIRVPGDRLLPPSAEPLIPADIGVGEVVRYYPPCPPWLPTDAKEVVELHLNPHHPKLDRRYWSLRDAFEEHPTYLGVKWINDPGPGLPGTGGGWGLDRVPEPVEFQVKAAPRKAGLPDLWHGFSGFIMSHRLLELLLDIDGEALVHRRIIMKDRHGQAVADNHHLVDVIRNIPAVDFANSIINYYGGQIYQGERTLPYPTRYVSVRLRDDLDPGFHIFRQAIDPRRGGGGCGVLVSDALRSRIEAMDPKPRNVDFGALYAGF